MVYGYFVRRCGDRGTAEDLTSETFLAAMDAGPEEAIRRRSRSRGCSAWRGTSWQTTTGAGVIGRRAGGRAAGAGPRSGRGDRRLGRRAGSTGRRKRAGPADRTAPDGAGAALHGRLQRSASARELIGRTVHATEALLVRARKAFRTGVSGRRHVMSQRDRRDPLRVLHTDDLPVQPDPAFAARLRRRLESALSLPKGVRRIERGPPQQYPS